MLLLVLALAIVAGYLTIAALRPATEPWRGREIAWSAVVGVALVSWLGQLLADLGWFGWWTLVLLVVGYGAALALWLRRRIVPRGLRPAWRELAALALVLIGAGALYGPSAETPIGGRDDGTRVMAGVALARHGGWLIHTPLHTDLPMYRGPDGDLKYLGFLFWNRERELVVPQFTGAHEVWQAIAYGWTGSDPAAPTNIVTAHPWMFRLNPLLALLALVLAYTLGRELFDPRAALLGTLLLAINVAQLWYARQTMSEILLQLLLLGGTATAISYGRDPNRAAAFATGTAFGVALLAKVDAVVAIALLGGVAVIVWPRRRRWPALRWLGVPLVLAIAHYALHSWRFSGAYFSTNVGFLVSDRSFLVAAGLGLIALAALLLARLRLRDPIDRLLLRPVPRAVRVACAGSLLLLAAYGYWVRPSVLAGESYLHFIWQQSLPTYRGLNVVLLAAYLTPLGALLALAGAARWITCDLRWPHLPFAALVIGYGIIWAYNARIVGDQPFWVRRFLPIVIPGALLLASAAIIWLWQARPVGRVIAPALALVLAAWSAFNTAPVAAIRSGAGLGAQVAALVAELPPDAVVLFEDWNAGFNLAAPLEIVYGRESYQLSGEPLNGSDQQRWNAQINQWLREQRPVVYVASSGKATLAPDQISFAPQTAYTLRYQTLETTHDRLPAQPIDPIQTLQLYRIEAADAQPCKITAQIGGADYGVVGAGMYNSETWNERQVRWTQPNASVIVPALGGSGDLLVTLDVFNGRPASAVAATLSVDVAGRALATHTLTDGWQPVSVPVPADLAAEERAITLDLHTPGWSPGATGQPDGRELGVALDQITAQRATCRTR